MSGNALQIRGGQFLLKDEVNPDLFTPEDFTEEHRLIQKTAAEFVEQEVLPNNEAIERQDFDCVVMLLRKAGELGLLAHSVPEEYGGLGLDKITKCIVGEAVGASGAYGVAHSNHTCIATLPITYFGTPEQKRKYLPKLASGVYLGAYCLTEPSSGSDALNAKTTARLNEAGTHYLLNGTKQFITNAEFADTFIVYAKVDGDKFTAFIVERGFPGLHLGPEENKMGIKGSSTRQVYFEDCLVPVENLLGEVGRGHAIALNVLNLGRFNLGSGTIGAAKHAFALALGYASSRRQFNRFLSDFPATQEKIADMACRIYAGESVQYRTAGYLEQALGDLYQENDTRLIEQRLKEFVIECSICKIFGSETLDFVVDEALQIHGGYGFIKEYHIEQMYRDARINRIFEGTNEINRLLIPTVLLRKAVTGDIEFAGAIEGGRRSFGAPPVFPEGPLRLEQEAVATVRRIFLACAGLVASRFHGSLQKEQEVAMKLADLAIQLYSMESAVLRAVKSVYKNGALKAAAKIDLAAAYVEDTMFEVEKTARKLLASLLGGSELRQYTSNLQHALSHFIREGGVERKRRIAGRLVNSKTYVS